MAKQREALHLALLNDQENKKKKKEEEIFAPSKDFPQIFTCWVEHVCTHFNVSTFLLLKDDGIILRVEDAPKYILPFTKDVLQNEFILHGRQFSKSLSFGGKKNRGLWIEWNKLDAFQNRITSATYDS